MHRFKYKHKDTGKEIEDLQKNQWYDSKLIEELQRLKEQEKLIE